jgi:competence protein ComEA
MENKEKVVVSITEKDLKGWVLLLFLLIAVIVLPTLLYQPQDPEEKSTIVLEKPSAELLETKKVKNSKTPSKRETYKTPKKWVPDTVEYNEKNPEKWQKAGLSKKTAHTLTQYLKKGGRIEKPEDLLKIYGIDSILWHQIKDRVKFPNIAQNPAPNTDETFYADEPSNSPGVSEKKKTKESLIPTVPLNQSDAELWKKLPGIGPAYATRIVKYREKLGGFYKIEQLKEVYALPDSVYRRIEPFLQLDTFAPSLPINLLNQAELSYHPYIDHHTAKLIISFRKQHGPITQSSDLTKLYGLEEGVIEKIVPYLLYQ